MNQVLMYIVIAGVFLGGMIPLVLAIIDYARENKELDKKIRKTSEQ
jgi:hypothetical protein